MEQTRILVFSKNEKTLETLLRTINNNGHWGAVGSSQEVEILHLFHQHPFDLGVFGSGVTNDEETRLRQIFHRYRPGIKVIRHLGDTADLLETEIRSALANRPDGI